MQRKKRLTHKEILEKNPVLEGVISEKSWDFIGHSDKYTVDLLKDQWLENIERNVKSGRLKRNGGMNRDCVMMGKNKAVVAIGAGPSLNKNKHILKLIHDIDGVKPFDERDFIFIASNHMFQPLLKEGIIPDFVAIADASDVILDQLTVGVPESAKNCTLIAGLHCNPSVLKIWEKQGRSIRFYLTGSPGVPEKYQKVTGKNPEAILVSQGGNVLNTIWSLSLRFLGSTVFMALGNDLSYPIWEDKDLVYLDDKKRRQNYYADKDYSTNEGTGRDEARYSHAWMGIHKIEKSNIISPDANKKYNIQLEPYGTTGNLWVYKTWIESNVLIHASQKHAKFNYYNCTEGGITGVMCKDDSEKGRDNIKNWYLLDDVCKRWRTRMFIDAIDEFLKAKEMLLKWQISQGARFATA